MGPRHRAEWRLLRTEPAAGAWNMAVDEAILTGVAAGTSPPTLRIFGWEPPCLSVGYFQPLAQVDMARCTLRGVHVVRRPTGGSAILHDNELTYSVTAPESDPLVSGDILASYRKIAVALLDALGRLGVPAALACPLDAATTRPDAGDAARAAPCFLRPSDFELLANRRKLVGSAQVRRGGALLQHGSLPLGGDVAEIAEVLSLAEEERAALVLQLHSHATTLAEILGRQVDLVEAATALETGFAGAWGIDLRAGGLSEAETRDADRLLSDTYSTAAWTQRR